MTQRATKERFITADGYALAFVFFVAGVLKLVALPPLAELFKEFGLPPAALILVGAVEVVVAVATVVPRTHPYGAMGACAVMAGAAITHAMTGVLVWMLLVNAAIFAAALWIVMNHRPGIFVARPPDERPHGTP